MRILRAITIATLTVTASGCLLPVGFDRNESLTTAVPLDDGDVLLVGSMQFGTAAANPVRYGHTTAGLSRALAVGPARVSMRAAKVGDGRVLVVGGWSIPDTDVVVSRDAVLFDAQTRVWTPAAAMHQPRTGRSQVLSLPDGRVVVIGGLEDGASAPAFEVYDAKTDRWTGADDLDTCWDREPAPHRTRSTEPAVVTSDGRVLLVSATCPAIFDPKTGTTVATARAAHQRFGATATLTASGEIIVIGGRTEASAQTEIYDVAADRWRPGPTLWHGRNRHTTTRVGDTIVVAGGRADDDDDDGVHALYWAELLNLDTGEHDQFSIGLRRWDHLAAPLPNGDVLLAGGSTRRIFVNAPVRTYTRLRLPAAWRD